ncbi:unnamed protein product [Closterium sp. NIES-53]
MEVEVVLAVVEVLIVEVVEFEVTEIAIPEVEDVAGAEPGGAESEGAESGGAEPRGTASAGGAGVPAGDGGTGGAGAAGPGGARTRGTRAAGAGGVGGAGAGDPGAGGTGAGDPGARGTGAVGARAGGARAGDPGAGGPAAGGTGAGGVGATSPGGAGVTARAGGPGGAGAADPGGARTRGNGAAGAGGVGGTGAGDPEAGGTRAGDRGAGGTGDGGAGAGVAGAGGPGAGGAGAGGTGAGDPGAGGAGAGDPGAGGAGARGAGAGGTGAGGTVQRRPFFVPPPPSSLPPPDSVLRQVLSISSSSGLPPSLLCPPPHHLQPQLQPDSQLPAPSPYAEQTDSLTERREPESRPASPICAVCTGRRVPCPRPPPVPGTHIMALRPSSVPLQVPLPSPPASSLADGPDHGSDLEDFECLAAAEPHLVAMLLALEGDLDAPGIPTPRFYAEAITGPYSSQWQTAMDAEMASWKSTGTFVDTVPPPGANIVDDMWIFRRDYELHSLDFSTAFLQGSLHEEIWLRRPPGFTGSFLAGTQWSLRRLVYGLRQAPREWHDTLRTTLAALGFAPSSAEPSLFLRPTLCCRCSTSSYHPGQTTAHHQSHMVHQVLQRFGFWYSSPQSTPLPTSHSLSTPPSDESVEPSGPYLELVGCLMYLMTCTRPDLAYPLSILARYVASERHRPEHWEAAKC